MIGGVNISASRPAGALRINMSTICTNHKSPFIQSNLLIPRHMPESVACSYSSPVPPKKQKIKKKKNYLLCKIDKIANTKYIQSIFDNTAIYQKHALLIFFVIFLRLANDQLLHTSIYCSLACKYLCTSIFNFKDVS